MSEQKTKKFKVVTLGCRTNQYESQAYRDQLLGMEYEQAREDEAADICIVNTCTVTESADSSSRHEIRQLTKKNPNAKIIVTGCSVERQPDKILAIPGVTDIVPNKEKEELIRKIFPDQDPPEFNIKNFEAHTRAFVKVQDGCNSFCTYCIIPYVRGRSRSRRMEEIITEVEGLIASGYKEVVITGINVGDFDGNKAKGEPPDRLSDLVRAVDAIPGLHRLRISSIDPDEVDDDLLDAVINGKTTCHSMHIVLQSGSNVVLKRMNRKYTRQMFFQTIERLKQASADFTFTTDVIVGFPGETEADFEETLEVIREVKFSKVHMFPYSPRPRTRAALYKDQIPQDVIKERKNTLLRLCEKVGFELRDQFIGRTMSVLVEADGMGHTDNFLPVVLANGQHKNNQLLDVRLVKNTPKGLVGEAIGSTTQ